MNFNRHSVAVDNRRSLTHTWQDRFRDAALTVLLILDICTIFLAEPLAAQGFPITQTVADTLVLAVLVIVVTLSLRWGANILILLGLAAIAASFLVSGELTPVSTTVLRRGGDILTSSALAWLWRMRSMPLAILHFAAFKVQLCCI
jgi:hypothetical protein